MGGMGGYGGGMGGMGGGMGGRGGGRNYAADDYFSYGGGGSGMRGGYGDGGGMGGMGAGYGAGYGGMGGAGGVFTVRMRGLPFRVTEMEIMEWFSSVADPVDVFIHYNPEGR